MKKLVRSLAVFMMLLCTCGVLAACDKTLSSIKVAGIETNYVVGDTLNTDNAVITAVYSDKTEEVIDKSLISISNVDMTTSGEKNVVVTYKGKTATVKITVYNSLYDTYEIVGFEKPSFVVEYESNKSIKGNKESEFYDRTQKYEVGDDNAFKFLPEITALDLNDNTLTLNAYKSIVKVYKQTGDSWTELTGSDLTATVAVDTEKSTFDFTDSAIGNTYKIEVKPENYEGNAVTFEFVVVDGYNIYDTKELALISNYTKWNSFKQENDLSTDKVKSVVFQNNLKLTADDVISTFLYNANDNDTKELISSYPNIVGTLRDFEYIYERDMTENETFTISGNYFTLDYSLFPYTEKFSGNNNYDHMSHNPVFKFNSDVKSTVNIKNINVMGNSNRSETVAKSGGLMVVKLSGQGITMNAYNNIIKAANISYFSQYGATTNLDKCKAYDNFSSILYSWGKSVNTITNCDFKRCGGPLCIIAHDDAQANPDAYGVYNIDNNTNLESFVTGSEAWFNIVGASQLVAALKSSNNGINHASKKFGQNKTFIRTIGQNVQELNVLCVIMNGANPFGSTTGTVRGAFRYKGSKLDMTTEDDTMETYRTKLKAAVEKGQISAMPAILQAGNTTIFTDGTSLLKLTQSGFREIEENEAGFFTGDYISMVQNNRMGMMLGFFTEEA